jgi:biopolymer transport protein ExbB/TolQ
MAAMVERLSGAIWPAALGLGVALVALWLYRYLLAELGRFDSEMENAALCLINHLTRPAPSKKT